LIFVDVGEDLVMVGNVVTPSNPPVTPIEKEELEEAPFDVNISKRLRDKDLF
jgi:hypothetical protein